MNKTPLAGVMCVAVATLALACSRSAPAQENPGRAAPPAAPAAAVPAPSPAGRGETTAPDPRPAASAFELSGVASPARTTRLAPKGSGLLKSVLVREGDHVKAGQTLAVLDAVDTELRREATAVAAEQAAENLRNVKMDYDRNQELLKSGVLNQAMWDKTVMAVKMAELQEKSVAVALRTADQALADTRLRAPFNGVITKVLAEEGSYITSMPPTTIFVLADTDVLEVRVPIPERKLAQVKVGVPVDVLLPAVQAERHVKVDRIPEVVDTMTRSAEAIIRVDNRDHALPAGVYARVRFPTLPADSAAPEETAAK